MTPAQLATLKDWVINDTTANAFRNAGDAVGLKLYLNENSTKVVWRSQTSTDVIRDAILWANMTPAAAPDSSALWTNRALYAQSKQIALQTIIQGRDYISSNDEGTRAGLQDCLTSLPTKNDGTNQNAGWTATQATMQRFATRAEAVFATGTGTSGSPADLVFEGAVSDPDAAVLVN